MNAGGSRRRRRARLTFAAVGAALLLTSGCLGWGQRGYDAGKAGYNPTEKTLTAATVAGLQPVWSVAGSFARTVSSGGRVHVLRFGDDRVAEIVTYGAASGDELWTASTGAATPAGYLAVLGDRVVATLFHHYNYCHHGGGCVTIFGTVNAGYDAATGAVATHPLATSDPGFASAGSEPTIGAHVALVPGYLTNSYESVLRAAFDGTASDRNVGSGSQLHPLLDEAAGVAYTTPAPSGSEPPPPVINAWPLTCDATPCVPLWTHPGSTEVSAFDASSGALYVAGNQLEVLDGATGTVAWTAPVASDTRPAVRNGAAFLVSRDGDLVSVPSCGAAACAATWSADLPSGGSLPPAAAGDVVYVATSAPDAATTQVTAYPAGGCGAATCTPLATVTAPGTATDLLIARGRVIVQTNSGLYAFGLPA